MFDSLFKAVVGVVKLPIDVAADVVTLGGAITDQDETYTGKGLRKIMENLDDATD